MSILNGFLYPVTAATHLKVTKQFDLCPCKVHFLQWHQLHESKLYSSLPKATKVPKAQESASLPTFSTMEKSQLSRSTRLLQPQHTHFCWPHSLLQHCHTCRLHTPYRSSLSAVLSNPTFSLLTPCALLAQSCPSIPAISKAKVLGFTAKLPPVHTLSPLLTPFSNTPS